MRELPQSVLLTEVGPRDGFQMERAFIPTPKKVQIINALSKTGLTRIETTSFVNPRIIPQMADAAEVMSQIERRSGVLYSALVPNAKGAERAIEAASDQIRVVVCVSEQYNMQNVGMTLKESIQECKAILNLSESEGVPADAIVALSFGCPLEGHISPEQVIETVEKLVDMGFREVTIADSIGVANPTQVQQLMSSLLDSFPSTTLGLHLHDTRGMALANVFAALLLGIRRFDTSFGGLGGCPVVPGGSGNISTEDLTNMLEDMGIATGVDIGGIRECCRIAEKFLKRSLPSHVLKVSTREELYREAPRMREQVKQCD